jgi:hypothetical protein
MKLELKHLAPYLPYGLMCLAQGEDKAQFELQGISDVYYADLHEIGRTVCEQYDFEDTFPILRPLSDLTEYSYTIGSYSNLEDFKTCVYNREVYALEWEDLLKHHFDVFGLIEKGLAIDINTL